MNILKIKLLGIFIVLFISTFSFAQDQQYLESIIKPDETGETYGMYIGNSGGGKECFIGYEYHADHGNGQNNHYRIAMRASTQPGSNGVFVGETGQLAVGTNDPCARLVDETTMLSVEGGGFKIDNPFWHTESNANAMKNAAPLENSMKKFMKVNFYSYEHKSTSGIQYGVIGEEIKEAFPNSVKSFKSHDEEHHYFNPNNLIFTGLKVVQENAKEIIEQEEQINTLQSENERLRAELEAERNRNNTQQRDIAAIKAALADLGVDLPQVDAPEAQPKPADTSIRIQTQGNNPRLEQNIPNPFSQFTTIPYYLPDGTQAATLVIRDMTGKIIAKHILPTQKGQSKIEINMEDTQLQGGTFTYSLYINGGLIDAKKMVLLPK